MKKKVEGTKTDKKEVKNDEKTKVPTTTTTTTTTTKDTKDTKETSSDVKTDIPRKKGVARKIVTPKEKKVGKGYAKVITKVNPTSTTAAPAVGAKRKAPDAEEKSAKKPKKTEVSEEESASDSEEEKKEKKKRKAPTSKKSSVNKKPKSSNSEGKKTPNKLAIAEVHDMSRYECREKAEILQPRQNANKWWNRPLAAGMKWETLEHNGVLFPPPYVPHGVKMLYDGKPVTLSPEAEEIATFYATCLESDHAKNPIFNKNFF